MGKYATISVPSHVKRILERAKGEDEWGDFLPHLYTEVRRLKSEKAFGELTEEVTDEDLKSIVESRRRFRERFTFR